MKWVSRLTEAAEMAEPERTRIEIEPRSCHTPHSCLFMAPCGLYRVWGLSLTSLGGLRQVLLLAWVSVATSID